MQQNISNDEIVNHVSQLKYLILRILNNFLCV